MGNPQIRDKEIRQNGRGGEERNKKGEETSVGQFVTEREKASWNVIQDLHIIKMKLHNQITLLHILMVVSLRLYTLLLTSSISQLSDLLVHGQKNIEKGELVFPS